MQAAFKLLLYLLLATFALNLLGTSLLGLCLLSGTCVPYLEYAFFAGSASFMTICLVLFANVFLFRIM